MNKNADYRKHNDRSHNSSTYHKKDGTPVRGRLKEELRKDIDDIQQEPEAEKNEIRKQEILAEIKRLRPHAEYDPGVWNEIERLATSLEGIDE